MGEGEGSAIKVCKSCQRPTCRGKNEGQAQRNAHKHDHRQNGTAPGILT